MNLSSDNSTAGVGPARRDSLVTALIKNLIVTLLCLIINYINGTQIHTFRKHQVCRGTALLREQTRFC